MKIFKVVSILLFVLAALFSGSAYASAEIYATPSDGYPLGESLTLEKALSFYGLADQGVPVDRLSYINPADHCAGMVLNQGTPVNVWVPEYHLIDTGVQEEGPMWVENVEVASLYQLLPCGLSFTLENFPAVFENPTYFWLGGDAVPGEVTSASWSFPDQVLDSVEFPEFTVLYTPAVSGQLSVSVALYDLDGNLLYDEEFQIEVNTGPYPSPSVGYPLQDCERDPNEVIKMFGWDWQGVTADRIVVGPTDMCEIHLDVGDPVWTWVPRYHRLDLPDGVQEYGPKWVRGVTVSTHWNLTNWWQDFEIIVNDPVVLGQPAKFTIVNGREISEDFVNYIYWGFSDGGEYYVPLSNTISLTHTPTSLGMNTVTVLMHSEYGDIVEKATLEFQVVDMPYVVLLPFVANNLANPVSPQFAPFIDENVDGVPDDMLFCPAESEAHIYFGGSLAPDGTVGQPGDWKKFAQCGYTKPDNMISVPYYITVQAGTELILFDQSIVMGPDHVGDYEYQVSLWVLQWWGP